MTKCKNSETFGQSWVVFCGELEYDPESKVFTCRECLEKKLVELTEKLKDDKIIDLDGLDFRFCKECESRDIGERICPSCSHNRMVIEELKKIIKKKREGQ